MQGCKQTQNQSVLEHGISVKNYLFDLLDHLEKGTDLKYDWRLPVWIYEYKDLILSKVYDRTILEQYTVYHDCGKPYCRIVDEEGKQHFPDHAEKSYQVFKSVFDNETAAKLIKKDMDIHLLKLEQVEEFASSPDAVTLLLTGLSELHSNSTMFGGVESISFKIKWKQINKRGKNIMCLLK